MEFDEMIVKESPGLCRCCLSEGCYKDLSTEYNWMEEQEIYADMLLECFDISISQHVEGPNGPNRLICEVCITRLRDACNFKKQVLESEKKFVDMIGRGEFKSKVIPYSEPMKAEFTLDLQPVEGTEVEYLDDDIDYDDGNRDDLNEPTVSNDVTVTTRSKGKRGRPKKSIVKPEKKKPKVEEKTKTKISKGEIRHVTAPEALSKSSMSAIKRNRLMKRNAIIVLESSTVLPFKWYCHNYLCFFCHRTFKKFEPLKQHTCNEHKTSSIKSAVSYLKRDEKVKIDVTKADCRLCGERFVDVNFLIDHIKAKHDKLFTEDHGYGFIPYKLSDDSFECAICDKNFQSFIKLNQHMNEHFGNYVCESCGKSFLSQDRLRCHALCHGSKFHCNLCPEIFASLTQRTNHELTAHNKARGIKCMFCPELFQNYVQRKRHHNKMHNVEISAANCPVCNKEFHVVSKMWTHVKEVHVREKKFSCSVCDKKFFSKTHLQVHMVKHTGEKIHQCDVCNKSYARKQTLKDHMRIHNNDRRFVCSLCSHAFIQKNSLQLHMRMHQRDSVVLKGEMRETI